MKNKTEITPVEAKKLCVCETEQEFDLCSSLHARIVKGCVLQIRYQAFSTDSSLYFEEEEERLNFCPWCGRKLEYKEPIDDEDNR